MAGPNTNLGLSRYRRLRCRLTIFLYAASAFCLTQLSDAYVYFSTVCRAASDLDRPSTTMVSARSWGSSRNAMRYVLRVRPAWGKERLDSSLQNGRCLEHWLDGKPLADLLDHPVTFITWRAAVAYCGWQGKRLPTEIENEWAAQDGISSTVTNAYDVLPSSRDGPSCSLSCARAIHHRMEMPSKNATAITPLKKPSEKPTASDKPM